MSEHQQKIDQINEWVRQYKEDGNNEAGERLLEQFHPLLIKLCNKLNKMYNGVHPWEHIIHEAQVMFIDLLNEYTIGGNAYFNVYIVRKLGFRLRYFFIKEIKRRTKYLSHSEEQFLDQGLMGSHDHIAEVAVSMEDQEQLDMIYDALDDDLLLNSRERDMVIRNVVRGESHESIAKEYNISRSRVSRIIKGALEKIRGITVRGYF